MKYPFVYTFLLTFLVSALFANDGTWLTDHTKALEKAKAENKLVLMDFTGSDWCPICIILDKEVFSQKEFKDYAEKKFVLLKVDFPLKKRLPEAMEKQNDGLMNQFKVVEFPALIAINSKGKEIWRGGYLPGGPSALIAELNKLKK